MPFSFANSFAGYTFSFSLLKNFFQNKDDALNASKNSILNVPLVNSSPFSLPFINQLLLQPFGNTKAAYNTNSQTTTGLLVPDSSFNAKGLSSFFAAAFTPGSVQYSSTSQFKQEFINGQPSIVNEFISATLTLSYSYQCTNTVYGGTCNNLPKVIFTFNATNKLSRSDSQYLHVPYWTDEQLSSSDASGCYPTVDRIQVHLEAASVVFDNCNIDKKYLGLNPGLDDNFPILVFKVVLDNATGGTLPSNNSRRPFVLSNIQNNGTEVIVFNGTYVYNLGNTLEPAKISNVVSQDTNTIGLVVLTNLVCTRPSGTDLVSTQTAIDVELGSFPTAGGALIASNIVNSIRNCDVVQIQCGETPPLFEGDGIYLGFEQLNTSKTKVPSMNATPQNRFQPTAKNHYNWQIVSLNADGTVNTNKKPGDPINYNENVGFYAYQCNPSDSYTTCGWLSAKDNTSCGTNCYPWMNSTSNVCEVWTLSTFPNPVSGPIKTQTTVTIQVGSQNICKYASQWLTNKNRENQNVPTLYKEFQDGFSRWELVRLFSTNNYPPT